MSSWENNVSRAGNNWKHVGKLGNIVSGTKMFLNFVSATMFIHIFINFLQGAMRNIFSESLTKPNPVEGNKSILRRRSFVSQWFWVFVNKALGENRAIRPVVFCFFRSIRALLCLDYPKDALCQFHLTALLKWSHELGDSHCLLVYTVYIADTLWGWWLKYS